MADRALLIDGGRREAVQRLARATAEPGFREHASGLVVPAEISRTRRVLTADQWKSMTRAIEKVFGPEEIAFILHCQKEGCRQPLIQRMRTADGYTLRCGCTDRVYSPAV